MNILTWRTIDFQAYSVVVSAAEGVDPDSDSFRKVDEVKQYPSITFTCEAGSSLILVHALGLFVQVISRLL